MDNLVLNSSHVHKYVILYFYSILQLLARSEEMEQPLCFFSTLTGFKQVECGPQRRDKCDTWELISCQELKNNLLGEHLLAHNVFNEKTIKSELDLVLWRSKQTTLTAKDCATWSICPSHREVLGLGWRTGKTKCQYVSESGQVCKKAGYLGVNSTVVKTVLKNGVFLQIGERKFLNTNMILLIEVASPLYDHSITKRRVND